MSTPILATVDLLADPDAVLAGYLEHVAGLGLSGRAVRGRTRIATAFLTSHPDLRDWMARPAAERVTELRGTGAWPLLCHVIGRGELGLDLEFAAVKNLTGLGRAVEARDPDGFAAVRGPGLALGWTPQWIETVLGECLAVLLAWHGGLISSVSTDTVDEFDAALAATQWIPASSRRAYRNRIAGLRQMLFQDRIVDTPPWRRRWARSYAQRFADAPMADAIRATLLRYVTVRASVLRPKSVESLTGDLLPFADYLNAAHPEVTSLDGLDRGHIEGFLVWNRTRSWRGQRAAAGAGRVISKAVIQSTVLSVRNLFDDITEWGWEQAPTRRLVFDVDVPKLDQPLPRALAPDIDTAVMKAVARLEDPFARIGLTVLRGAGLRVGELLDLELGSVIDYGPAGTWLKVPLGKLATERMVPLSATTITALDQWTTRRGVCRPLPHPRTGALTDFLFVAHGRRLGQTRLRNGLLAAVESCGLRGTGGAPLVVTPHQLRHTWATELANAGMSLQALTALLGHVTEADDPALRDPGLAHVA
nr:tyrosine-type recombinase/integrase [Rhodococcus ruber]